MSTDSNTPAAESELRQMNVTLGVDLANEILATLGVPVPDAAELDEIRITICASDAHENSAINSD